MGSIVAFVLAVSLEMMIFKNVNFSTLGISFLKSSILTIITAIVILLIIIVFGHIKIKKVTPVALFKN